MSLGRQGEDRQQEFWIASNAMPRSAGHVFYEKLNGMLADAEFDRWLESRCEAYYADRGRPSIPPGVYFRMLLVGYFESLGSQRGIAWRCADSLSLRRFLGIALTESTPDHSSLTRIRDRLPFQVHEDVFRFVLHLAAERGLIEAKQVAVDATTLEANAAMKSIVRRDSGDDWETYLKQLMIEAGAIKEGEEPTSEDLRRFDKQRRNKKVSNEDWKSPSDPDSRITKMKDGRTHLAYKAEHVLDLQTEIILAAPIYSANDGDSETLCDSVMEAQTALNEAGVETWIEEVVADKGYHSARALEQSQWLGLRTYIPEPKLKHKRRWTDKPAEYKTAVYANRRRTRTSKSKRLQRLRSERAERSFAHVCETGGGRRTWLRGQEKVSKRYLMQAMAHNLGIIMRSAFGFGTARRLQGLAGLFLATYIALIIRCHAMASRVTPRNCLQASRVVKMIRQAPLHRFFANRVFSTGC